MTYESVTKEIEGRRRFAGESGLVISGRLLDALERPEKGARIIHIAGTNGKGSTAAFLSSMLEAAGFCVGKFTSPHLETFTERITVDGRNIPEDEVVELFEEIDQLEEAKSATMFDLALVMAALYFRKCGCDFWVMETGLGGRLDSTTALLDPELCVITSIDFDHCAILGDSIQQIAKEKAGIIRSRACVSAPQRPEAMDVIREVCEKSACRLIEAKPDTEHELGLIGEYQKENAGTALAAARLLGLDEKAITYGLKRAYWPGRMEIVSKEPFVLLDGAHNPQGIRALTTSLKALYPGEKFRIVCGMMADKDTEGMLSELSAVCHVMHTVTVAYNRSSSAEELLEQAVRVGIEGSAFDSAKEALAYAITNAGNEKIIVCGSLYFIGEVKSELKELL